MPDVKSGVYITYIYSLNNKYNMRIILTGAQSTGKSVILKTLQEKYGGKFHYITEVVRNLAKTEGINVNEMGDEEGQNMIFSTYEKLLGNTESYVSDRGLTDVCAYSYYHAETKKGMNHVAADELARVKQFVKDNPDVLFFYFPIEFDVVNDGFRSTNEDFRHKVDQLILAVLMECKIPYIEVHGTVEERIAIIDKYINAAE